MNPIIVENRVYHTIEWGCVKVAFDAGMPALHFLSPTMPGRHITFHDADLCSNVATAVQSAYAQGCEGIISREAIEYFSYRNLVTHPHPEEEHVYSASLASLGQIVSSPGHAERIYLIFLQESGLDVSFVNEYFAHLFPPGVLMRPAMRPDGD